MTSAAKSPQRSDNLTRRVLIGVVGVILVAMLSWFVYATVNILKPSQGQLQKQSDAVVSLAPQPVRLPLAQQLIDDGVADTLVISFFDHDPLNFPSDPTETPLHDHCESDGSPTIICFPPEENATIGEAYGVAALAREHSWNSLTIVTDTTHVFRTRFIFEQCLGDELELNVVVADMELSTRERIWHAIYENAAFVKAVWQTTWRC